MHVLLIIMLAPLALCFLALCFGIFLVRIWPVVLGLFVCLLIAAGCFYAWAMGEANKNNAKYEAQRNQIIMAHPGITNQQVNDRMYAPERFSNEPPGPLPTPEVRDIMKESEDATRRQQEQWKADDDGRVKMGLPRLMPNLPQVSEEERQQDLELRRNPPQIKFPQPPASWTSNP